MKRYIAILGTLLIVGIFLSGSAVAGTCHCVQSVYSSTNCTNPKNAVGAPDGKHATIGQNPSTLGSIILDLGSGHEMGANQDFTVFASSTTREQYELIIGTDPAFSTLHWCGYGYDDNDEVFTTPNSTGWRYILIIGVSGVVQVWTDPIYGPEIDAVCWCE